MTTEPTQPAAADSVSEQPPCANTPYDEGPFTLAEQPSEQALPLLPIGWSIELEGDTVKVASPVSGPGVIVVAKESHGHAQRMLYALCTALQQPAAQATAPVADDMLEPLIYAAIVHNGKPKTLADFKRAAANVADMLKRRAASPAAQAPAPEPTGYLTRFKIEVEQQRQQFPGEEPDYLWRYTHGTKYLATLEADGRQEVVRLYAQAPAAGEPASAFGAESGDEGRNGVKRKARLLLSRHFADDAKILRLCRGRVDVEFMGQPEDWTEVDE
jgi:hypothetical protein